MYEAMCDHWEAYGPPVYMSVASYLGLNKGKKKDNALEVPNVPAGTATEEEIAKYGNLNELAALFGGSGGQIH